MDIMEDTAIVMFENLMNDTCVEIEIPLNITANELCLALNDAFVLGMNIENIFECYLISENPIALLRGNKKLYDYGIQNGTTVIYNHR